MHALRMLTLLAMAAGLAGTAIPPAAAVPGDLDPAFGGDGRVTLPVAPPGAGALDTAIAPGGKILAAGGAGLWTCGSSCGYSLYFGEPAVARFNPDGTPDSTFGGDGVVVVPVPAGGNTWFANAVAVQSDGRPIIAGEIVRRRLAFVLARFRTDGTLDPSFGGDGIVVTAFRKSDVGAEALAVQDDGKIVAAGYRMTNSNSTFNDAAFVRYLPDGRLDPSFGEGGRAIAKAKGPQRAQGLDVLPNGKILAGGLIEANFGVFVERLRPGGSLDRSFSGDGIARARLDVGDSWYTGFAVQPDGKPIASLGHGPSSPSTFILVRFDTDGSRDETFGTNGKVVTPVPSEAVAQALAVQADGRIVAAGGFSDPYLRGPNAKFVVARYEPDGALDTSFGTNGILTTAFDEGASGAYAIVLQPDGDAVVAGSAGNDEAMQFALARYRTS